MNFQEEKREREREDIIIAFLTNGRHRIVYSFNLITPVLTRLRST